MVIGVDCKDGLISKSATSAVCSLCLQPVGVYVCADSRKEPHSKRICSHLHSCAHGGGEKRFDAQMLNSAKPEKPHRYNLKSHPACQTARQR